MTPAMPTDIRTVLVTAPDAGEAARITRTVVEEGLAACGNVISNVVSIFRWEGAVERAEEALIVLKTSRAGADALRERVVELHPYDVPEVLVLAVESGHAPYLGWVVDETTRGT